MAGTNQYFSSKVDPSLNLDNWKEDVKLQIGSKLQVRGFTSVHGVNNFLGVPYASIPARFLTAEMVLLDELSGSLDARYFGPRCPQGRDEPHFLMQHLYEKLGVFQRMSEFDCLNLNIYSPPDTVRGTAFPIFVYIHGGAYVAGDNTTEFDGNHLVAKSIAMGQPIVVITLNYRLGYFGMFTSKELVEEQKSLGKTPIFAQGSNDQRLALQWIQRYASYFRGDKGSVTLSGESAGGASCWTQLKGNATNLFHRCIIQSMPPGHAGKFEDHQKRFDTIIDSLGILADSPRQVKLAALRSLPPQELLSHWDGSIFTPPPDPNWLAQPKAGVEFASYDYWIDTPAWVDQIVVGCTNDEAALFGCGTWPKWTWNEAKELVKSSFVPELVPALLDADVFAKASSPFKALVNVGSEATFIVPTTVALSKMAKAGKKKTFMYIVETPDPFDTPLKGFAWHSYGNPILFQQPACQKYPELGATSDKMAEAYVPYFYGKDPWESIGVAERYMSWSGTSSGMKTIASRTDRKIELPRPELVTELQAGGFGIIAGALDLTGGK